MATTTYSLNSGLSTTLNVATTNTSQFDPILTGDGGTLTVLYGTGSATGSLSADVHALEGLNPVHLEGIERVSAPTANSGIISNSANGERHVVQLANGNTLFVWDEGQSAQGIRASVYDTDGAFVIGSTILPGLSNSNVNNIAVAPLSGGGFALSYDIFGTTGVETYTDSLGVVGGTFAPTTLNIAGNTSVDSRMDAIAGQFVVATRGQNVVSNPGNEVIELNWFNEAGQQTSGPTRFGVTGQNGDFDVALMSNGNAVLVYEDESFAADPDTISLRIVQPDGTIVGGQNTASRISNQPKAEPSVTVLDNDFIVLAYQIDFSSDSDIEFRVFDPLGNLVLLDGQAANGSINVRSSTFDENSVSVTDLGAGKFALAWQTDESDGGFGRIDGRVYEITSATTVDGPAEFVPLGGLRDLIEGGTGNDTLVGNAGDDTLIGNDGTDLLNGGLGGDSIVGGAGYDFVDFRSATAAVGVFLGNGSANIGEAAGDTYADVEAFIGSDFGDTLVGGADADYLYGWLGPDQMNSRGGGADTLLGNGGNDIYFINIGEDAVTAGDVDTILEGADEGIDTVYINPDAAEYTLPENVEYLVYAEAVDGQAFTFLNATGNALDNRIDLGNVDGTVYGLAGDDTLVGGGDWFSNLSGGEGNDRLEASASGAAYFAENPDDLFGSLAGYVDVDANRINSFSDTMIGGVLGDTYEVDSLADEVIETGPNDNGSDDTILTYLDVYSLTTQQNIENLILGGNPATSKTGTGNDLDNELLAVGVDNLLNGGAGDDTLTAGVTGIDGSGYTTGADTMNGGSGVDVVSYVYTQTDGLVLDLSDTTNNTGQAADDTWVLIEGIEGTGGNDTIKGDDGANILEGKNGQDTFIWSAGHDTIDGGFGDETDTMTFVTATQAVRFLGTENRAEIGNDLQQVASVENITGSIYGDYIVGTDEDNRLRGLGDYDWFVGSAGNDYYDGGNGRDMISYADADAGVTVSLADSGQNAGQADGDRYVSIERVTGSVHIDIFYGDDGANDFRGLGGFDVFYSSAGGRERYDGGNGSDTVTYVNAGAGVIANLARGFGSGGDARLDLYKSIENLGGSAFDDVLTGTDERNNLRALGGDDTIFGGGGIDRIAGGRGNDVIDGGAGSDYILFKGDSDQFDITREAGTRNATVSWNGPGGGDGTDTLLNVEYLVFDDTTISIWSL